MEGLGSLLVHARKDFQSVECVTLQAGYGLRTEANLQNNNPFLKTELLTIVLNN